MAMVTYPLNNVQYSAEDAELYNAVRTSGVWSGAAFDADVTGNDTVVTIGEGLAWIANTKFSGKVVAQKEPKELDLGTADPSYNRFDVIAIQFDSIENKTDVIVKKGVASQNPEIPERSTTESLYELYLYSVLRTAGSSVISKSNIKDLRDNREYCGYMQDSIKPGYAPSLMEHNKRKDFRFWVGTRQEYNEQQASIPENTFCVITDDPNDQIIDHLITNTGRQDIYANGNLNVYTYCCRLKCMENATAATLSNCPTREAFTMDVVSGMGVHTELVEGQPYESLLQKIVTITGNEYFRSVYTNGSGRISFGDWKKNVKDNESLKIVDLGAAPIQHNVLEFDFFIGEQDRGDGTVEKTFLNQVSKDPVDLGVFASGTSFVEGLFEGHTVSFYWASGGYMYSSSKYDVSDMSVTGTNHFTKLYGVKLPV